MSNLAEFAEQATMQKEVALDEMKAQLVRYRVSVPELEPEPTEEEIKQVSRVTLV